MNKLTKLMLATAILATSGFATGDVVVTNGGKVNAYNDTIGIPVTVGCGGTITVHEDVALQNKLILEKGSAGTIAEGKELTNENELTMTWDDETPGVFAPCGGYILQTTKVERTRSQINRDVDGTGDKVWYVYEGKLFNATAGDVKTYYLLYNCDGCEEYGCGTGGWLKIGKADYPLSYSFEEVYAECGDEIYSIGDPEQNESDKSVKKVYTDVESVNVLQVNGIDSIVYNSGKFTDLTEDTTVLGEGVLEGKSAKKLYKNENVGFSPDIPDNVAPIKIADPDNVGRYSTFGTDMSSVSDATTLQGYFASFGISFKKTDGRTNSTVDFIGERTPINALVDATDSDAVLIDNNEIAVGEGDVTVATNLHNIGVEDKAPSFAGNGELELTGDNRWLECATFANPTKISGTNALPTNAVFNGNLTINESVTVGDGNSVTVKGGFSVTEGKSVSVAGVLNLGSASVKE